VHPEPGGSHLPGSRCSVRWKEVDPPATKRTFISQIYADVKEGGHADLIGGTMDLGIQVIAGQGNGSWRALGAVATSGTY
jgi:hypothetical protein